jgi:hypothetical protein
MAMTINRYSLDIPLEERTVAKSKGILGDLQRRVDGFFYSCEYIKECDKLTPQCREGGSSYCGEYKKRSRQKAPKQSG